MGAGTPANPYRLKASRYFTTWTDISGKYQDQGDASISATADTLTANWIAADPTFDADPPTIIYVSPDGLSTAVGSQAAPIDLATALGSTQAWRPNCTMYFLEGTYSGTITITIGNITIDGVGTLVGSLRPSGVNTTLKNILFTNPAFTERTTEQAGSNPTDIDIVYRTNVQAVPFKAIGCVYHDSATLFFSGLNNVEISDAILYYGGWVGPDRGHGHGIYASGDTIKIKNCIILDMFGYGIHCYGEGTGVLLKNIDIENCIVIGAGEILTDFSNSNILVGGSSGCHADHPIIKNNSTFHRGAAGAGIQVGYGAYGYDGGTVQDNVIVGGANSLTLVGDHVDAMADISGNWFGSAVSGFTAEEWTDNTYSSGIPDVVKVYPSEYTNTLAHVAIFNGSSANTVSVDLSAVTGLSAGDDVTVANVQDLFVDIVTLTLDADKKIAVDMRAISHTVATPQGWDAPATTFPTFGAFVVEKA